MSLLEAILREDALHNNSSGSQQVCTFNRHSVVVGYLPGRFPLQFMQSLVEIILCHNELLWIGGELKQVISTATHKNSTLAGKHDGKFVHEGSDVICQSLNLFFGGRIVGQELLRHVACANRQTYGKGWRWTVALDHLRAPAPTIHDKQRGLRHGWEGCPAEIQSGLFLTGNQRGFDTQCCANQFDECRAISHFSESLRSKSDDDVGTCGPCGSDERLKILQCLTDCFDWNNVIFHGTDK